MPGTHRAHSAPVRDRPAKAHRYRARSAAVAMFCPGAATFQNRTVWSELPLAKVLRSGLNATELTGPVWPVRAAICWWVATSHNWTLPPAPPLARVVPSGLNATEKTGPLGTRGAPIGWWVATSHSNTVPSELPL